MTNNGPALLFLNTTNSKLNRYYKPYQTTERNYGLFDVTVLSNTSIFPRAFVFFYLCMALQPFLGSWPLFRFLDLLQSRWGSLDRGSAPRKAATYTQDSTNTE
jgi:hypothetical protein